MQRKLTRTSTGQGKNMYVPLKGGGVKALRGERWHREKGSAVTGSGKGSHFNSVSCKLNPEPLIL